MPLPLIPIISAVSTGGVLVPHAAGGMIVTSGATGYVTGTYIGAATIGTMFFATKTALATSIIFVSAALTSFIGGAGIFGTVVGSSGLTGFLMSLGIISATPLWIPIAIGALILGGFGALYLSGAIAYFVGEPGILGSKIGATGLHKFLMEWEIISYTPTWVVVILGVVLTSLSIFVFYSGLATYRIQKKIKGAQENEDLIFTPFESFLLQTFSKLYQSILVVINSIIKGINILIKCFNRVV